MSPKPPFESAQYLGNLPRNWEKAFGYNVQSPARWIAAWWQPAGDEAMLDDGRISGDANWPICLDLVDRRLGKEITQATTNISRGRWVLGSSDSEATHCLLCDLERRHVFIAPIGRAHQFLIEQHKDYQNAQPLLEVDPEEFAERIRCGYAEETERRRKLALALCRGCMYGYVPADNGYDPCPQCDGEHSRWMSPDKARELSGQWDVIWPGL